MKIQQKKFSAAQGWEMLEDRLSDAYAARLVLAFGSGALLEKAGIFNYTIQWKWAFRWLIIVPK